MKFVHGLLSAFLLMNFAMLPAPARADAEAQKFLEAIYKQYVGQNTPGVALGSNDVLFNYFTPELAALIAADADQAQKNDEVPALDGDPFVGAQDWDIKDVSVTVKDIGPGKALGLATFTNMGEKQAVELDLKKLPQGWRIDEIRWPDASLRGILKGEEMPAGEPEETRKL
ncbi:MAG TPA: DUF3828 domain-containing protein [Xanthobacteraceae bacterium]|jgi:hypothetical protein|nr:DUF3828 domain-containing protein [Xanthobacteraceae bacterium]